MYLNTQIQYYNTQLHMGSSDKSEQVPVSRDKLSRLRREAIIPLKSKLLTHETHMTI
jgi:hypothetical protein